MIDVVVVFSIPEDHPGAGYNRTVVYRLEIEGTPEQFLVGLDAAHEMNDDLVQRGEAAPGSVFRIVMYERLGAVFQP